MRIHIKKSIQKIAALTLVLFALLLAAFHTSSQTIPYQWERGDVPARSIDVRALDWSISGSNKALLSKVPKRSLAKFIYQIIQQGNDEQAKEYYGSFGADQLLIGDYIFKDLNGDGRLELIASVDVTGRPFFNTLVVVTKVGDQFIYDKVQSWGESHDFSKEIEDLNGDGRLELLAREQWVYPFPETHLKEAFDESGVWTLPDLSWVKIYSWDKGRLSDATHSFPEYYQDKYVPEMERTIAKINQFDDSSPEEKQVLSSYYQVNLFKAQRALGHGDAGLQESTEWAHSDNVTLRENAILVLSEIKDKRAVEQLRYLASDRDDAVSRQAENALEGWRENEQ